jgi:hypothetical protein
MDMGEAVTAAAAFAGAYLGQRHGVRRLRVQVARLLWRVVHLARRVRHLERTAGREA